MIFKDIIPSSHLKEFVQLYRVRHFIIPDKMSAHPKPYPVRPEHCMVFYPRGYETTILNADQKIVRPSSVITGQFTNRIERLTNSSEFLMIMVIFNPGALHRLTGIPSSEFCNKHIDLESVYPRETKLLNEQLCNSENYADMIVLIEKYLSVLVEKVKIKKQPADEIFNVILKYHKKYSLDWLAKEACLSIRQFERKADQYLGVSPVHFARIVRFNQSYEMKLNNLASDWWSIAIACGFYDYQHMVRDYKEFASANPNKLFEAESKSLERVLGLNK